MVTRNPCCFPGDIRLLNAVFKRELIHMRNVVVFSSKGERPETNKISGGDLDGDVYLCIWDDLLISNMKEEMIEEPATFDE